MSRAPSLLYPSQMSTTSFSTLATCTPVRLSTPPSTRLLLTLSSHRDYTCVDSSTVSFGPVPESTSCTGYEPKNLIEVNSMEIKPMFFHKPSMTSTCDTSESIATPPSWIGFGWWTNSDYVGFTVLTAECQVHLTFERRRAQGNPSHCLHTRESSQGLFSDREDLFLWNINRLCGTTNLFSDSLIQKLRWDHLLKNIRIICSQKQNLKCESRKAERIFSIILLAIFRDNLIPIDWKSIVLIIVARNLKENKENFVKNQLIETEFFEKLKSEVFTTWKIWRGLRKCTEKWEKITLQYRNSLHN